MANLKSTKGKTTVTYKETPIRLSTDFSTETLQARREWHDVLKVMKGENVQQRIFDPVKLSCRFDGEIKSFTERQKLKMVSTKKSALQEILKGLF